MEFNKSKCHVLHASKRKSQTINVIKPYVKDLGVIVSSDLTWSKHIEVIVAKANKTLGLIKRLVKDTSDLKVKKILYCALVRPILEYACNLWSPYTVKDRHLIENVQRRATKFILNYPQDLKYVDRLIKINILPLEFRRDISDLCLVFKSRNGAITMDVNNFINTYEPGYKSRNYDENNYHLIIKHRQDYFRNSLSDQFSSGTVYPLISNHAARFLVLRGIFRRCIQLSCCITFLWVQLEVLLYVYTL